MQQLSFAELLRRTIKLLTALEQTLANQAQTPSTPRVGLLARALVEQETELIATVTRILDKQGARVRERNWLLNDDFPTLETTPDYFDSRLLAMWLVGNVSKLANYFQPLAEKRQPGQDALSELHRLFVAHGKRLALECHRFEDL
ncbi:MAG TPA: hypothetical protein DER02_10060 [Gammaproteobacteria bacterium]|nr:hypothetical protein [Gammaproteobacteria bacterium]